MRSTAAQLLRGAAQRRGFTTTPRRLDNYAFVGLGQMGYQMAKNLQSKLKPSDRLSLFDINSEAMQSVHAEMKVASKGAAVTLAASAHDAAKEADIVITVLPESRHVTAVYDTILTAALPKRDRVFIDCSTIDQSTSLAVGVRVAAARQGHLVDAPMSGGVVGATAGQLTFMLGGPAALRARVEPVLLTMGRRVLHCGGQGAGIAAKLANNYLLAVSNVAAAEAMNLGIRGGAIEPATLAAVLNASTGRCWPTEVNNPVPGVVEGAPAGRDYRGGFGIALMRKDLRLAVAMAADKGARLELAGEALRVYEEAAEREDCKGRDFSVVYRYIDGKV